MRVRVLDLAAREVPPHEARELFKALGLGKLWHDLDTVPAGPHAPARALAALANYGDLEYSQGAFAGAVSANKLLKLSVLVQRAGDGEWEVVFGLPFEYSALAAFLASALNELREELEERFSRLNGSLKSAEARIAGLERRVWKLERERAAEEEEEEEEEDGEEEREDDW